MFSVHYKMQVNTREGIILLTLVSGLIMVSVFICIHYNLISNILILNGRRFSFHVDVTNRQYRLSVFIIRVNTLLGTLCIHLLQHGPAIVR